MKEAALAGLLLALLLVTPGRAGNSRPGHANMRGVLRHLGAVGNVSDHAGGDGLLS